MGRSEGQRNRGNGPARTEQYRLEREGRGKGYLISSDGCSPGGFVAAPSIACVAARVKN
jgi:hypothetical protein